MPADTTGPWVAAKRMALDGGVVYERHPDSPKFTDVGDLMGWLGERGLITPPADPEDTWAGWGNPWYAIPVYSSRLVDAN